MKNILSYGHKIINLSDAAQAVKLVGWVGFEPTRGCKPYRIKSPMLSAN